MNYLEARSTLMQRVPRVPVLGMFIEAAVMVTVAGVMVIVLV